MDPLEKDELDQRTLEVIRRIQESCDENGVIDTDSPAFQDFLELSRLSAIRWARVMELLGKEGH